MPDIPATALVAAAEAIMTAANLHEIPERFEARNLARAALEAAAPLLAEAWGVKPPPSALELERAAARALARSVACPSCGAAAGEMCRTMESRTAGVAGYTQSAIHAARKRAALAAVPPTGEEP